MTLPSTLQWSLRLLFHASLSGAFLVAYLTGDEDTYHMHVFAGYLVLATVCLRVIAGLALPGAGPLRLPRLRIGALGAWLSRIAAGDPSAFRGHSPLSPWLAAAALAGVGLAAASGALADAVVAAESLHESLADAALWLVAGHVAVIVLLNAAKRLRLPSPA